MDEALCEFFFFYLRSYHSLHKIKRNKDVWRVMNNIREGNIVSGKTFINLKEYGSFMIKYVLGLSQVMSKWVKNYRSLVRFACGVASSSSNPNQIFLSLSFTSNYILFHFTQLFLTIDHRPRFSSFGVITKQINIQ